MQNKLRSLQMSAASFPLLAELDARQSLSWIKYLSKISVISLQIAFFPFQICLKCRLPSPCLLWFWLFGYVLHWPIMASITRHVIIWFDYFSEFRNNSSGYILYSSSIYKDCIYTFYRRFWNHASVFFTISLISNELKSKKKRMFSSLKYYVKGIPNIRCRCSTITIKCVWRKIF